MLLDADGTTNIFLTFSEPISVLTATNPANYVISNLMDGTQLSISKVVMTSSSNVLLTTSRRVEGNNYIVSVRNLQDLASTPNMIAESTAPLATTLFLVTPFSYYDFYLPYPPFDDPCIGDDWRCGIVDWPIPETWGNNDSQRGAFWCGNSDLPVSTGWELSPSPAVINYFRTHFQFAGSPLGARVQLRHVVDSGAVFYLNCQELLRFNMPGGLVTCTNTALKEITNGTWSDWLDVPFDLLQPTNLAAIELHSAKSWESTLTLAVDMQARIYSLPNGPIIITRQPEDQTVFEGQPVSSILWPPVRNTFNGS